MVSPQDKALYEHIASLTGWEVAKHFNCEFDGDCHPIVHGGFFYDLRDWEAYGYANAVEFWEDPETGHLIVQNGTIHKPTTPQDWESCWSCADIPTEERHLPRAQVYAAQATNGIEPDGTTYPALKEFNLETWQEWRIWRSIASELTGLGR